MADERRTPLCESGGETTTREGMQGSVFRELMEIEPSNEQVEANLHSPTDQLIREFNATRALHDLAAAQEARPPFILAQPPPFTRSQSDAVLPRSTAGGRRIVKPRPTMVRSQSEVQGKENRERRESLVVQGWKSVSRPWTSKGHMSPNQQPVIQADSDDSDSLVTSVSIVATPLPITKNVERSWTDSLPESTAVPESAQSPSVLPFPAITTTTTPTKPATPPLSPASDVIPIAWQSPDLVRQHSIKRSATAGSDDYSTDADEEGAGIKSEGRMKMMSNVFRGFKGRKNTSPGRTSDRAPRTPPKEDMERRTESGWRGDESGVDSVTARSGRSFEVLRPEATLPRSSSQPVIERTRFQPVVEPRAKEMDAKREAEGKIVETEGRRDRRTMSETKELPRTPDLESVMEEPGSVKKMTSYPFPSFVDVRASLQGAHTPPHSPPVILAQDVFGESKPLPIFHKVSPTPLHRLDTTLRTPIDKLADQYDSSPLTPDLVPSRQAHEDSTSVYSTSVGSSSFDSHQLARSGEGA